MLAEAMNAARYVLPSPLLTLAHMLYRLPGAHFQNGLLSVHNSDFRRDPKFREAYAPRSATKSWGNAQVEWRVYICCWAAWTVKDKPGDFVECGVNTGGLSRAVMHYIDFERLDKRFWLLDTYEGLPGHLISEDERRRGIVPGGYAACYNQVVETFRPFARIEIVKGVVPNFGASDKRPNLLSLDRHEQCGARDRRGRIFLGASRKRCFYNP